MNEAIYIKSATAGFKGFLWRVSRGDEQHIVHACDNYTAAEVCGWTFATCRVERMQVVPADK